VSFSLASTPAGGRHKPWCRNYPTSYPLSVTMRQSGDKEKERLFVTGQVFFFVEFFYGVLIR